MSRNDPTLSPEQRRRDLAAILARGLRRLLRSRAGEPTCRSILFRKNSRNPEKIALRLSRKRGSVCHGLTLPRGLRGTRTCCFTTRLPPCTVDDQAIAGALRRGLWRGNLRQQPCLAHQRIAWRLQALAEGDLTERARRRAAELANDADIRMFPPKEMKATVVATEQTETGSPAVQARRPLAGRGNDPDARVQGSSRPGASAPAGFRVRGPGLQVAQRRGQGGHRQPCQRLRLLQDGPTRRTSMKNSRTTQQADTFKAVRCAVYTRKSTEEGLQRNSTRWTLSANRQRRTSSASSTRAGPACPIVTTTVASPAATWTGQP